MIIIYFFKKYSCKEAIAKEPISLFQEVRTYFFELTTGASKKK
jgi:hypothetical protein